LTARAQRPLTRNDPTAPGRAARVAVALAAGVVVVLGAGLAIFAVAYLVGGADATEDNWVGAVGAVALLGGLAASLAAFVAAIAAVLQHERGRSLWLPLALLPALVTLIVVGEAFLWE
jgi:hypothetical protein